MFDKKKLHRMWTGNPTIYNLLRDSDSYKAARNHLHSYLGELLRILYHSSEKMLPLEFHIQMSCIITFRRIISYRSERITNFNIVELLWKLAQEKYDELTNTLTDGFLEHIYRLFLGLQGKSGIYDDLEFPQFLNLKGREAAEIRSQDLDALAQKAKSYMERYPSGLDREAQKIREENKRRILDHFKATVEDWADYRWHLRHIIRNDATLKKLIDLTKEETRAIQKANTAEIPFGITPYYVSLMDKKAHRKNDHAVRAQVIPPMDYVDFMIEHKGQIEYSSDFMLERDTSPVDLVTRRYPNIAILKPYNTCSQICVYCQRNWEIDDVLSPGAMADKESLERALQWFQEHPMVNEVLVTGGDPLVMGDRRINWIMSKLSEMDHIERIRIGSRTPVVLPQRITDSLIDIISKYHEPGRREIALVTHFEHPYEVTPDAMQAVQKFKRRGISVYNQAVYTLENSRRFELVALRRALRLIGVDSYYAFNTKGKEETKSYRVPIARLQQEVKEEARLATGLVRTDEPVYNVPRLGKNYIRAQQHHSLLTILPDGRPVYEFHPWEKNLSLVDTYVDTDVSIYEYLQELKRRGEDLDEYKTIWYYF
jgi:lysine 2,3-aminomutase